MKAAMKAKAAMGAGALLALAGLASGCTTIKEKRGYMVDNMLVQQVQPGLDNKKSVERTLGRPTFTSLYGEESWYYVSSMTTRKPFRSDKIKDHDVVAVNFNKAGGVASIDRFTREQITALDPVDDKTPTLGKKRTFLQDLFGNIGAVGAGGAGAGGGAGGGGQ